MTKSKKQFVPKMIKQDQQKLIQLKYKLGNCLENSSAKEWFETDNFVKYFKSWKLLDNFVMSEKIEKYKVNGPSSADKDHIITYSSVLWDEAERVGLIK